MKIAVTKLRILALNLNSCNTWHRFPAKLYTFIINDTGRIKITYCRYFKSENSKFPVRRPCQSPVGHGHTYSTDAMSMCTGEKPSVNYSISRGADYTALIHLDRSYPRAYKFK